MGDKTGIEWTEATWNPVVGCSIKSPGCTNCYAMGEAARLERMGGKGGAKYAGLTKPSKAGPVWTGEVRLHQSMAALAQPLRWKRPRRIFVNSMSDLFHEDMPVEAIDRVFVVMALAAQHTFQVLTKRSARMRAYMADFSWARAVESCRDESGVSAIVNHSIADLHRAFGLSPRFAREHDRSVLPVPNVWLGVSVEDQKRADERVPDLLATTAALRFLSMEPLLGPVRLSDIAVGDEIIKPLAGLTWYPTPKSFSHHGMTARYSPKIDWVIVGGESGPKARPMHPDWVRDLRDDCASAGVPFLFKQWGEWAPGENAGGPMTRTEQAVTLIDDEWRFERITPTRSAEMHRDDEPDLYRIGKRAAGRRLDGVVHDDTP
ncbi:Phage protein [Azospirillum argentinense]|uniref:phage Gp37/Gp68 family protein n=1 Tax=Azospirillum argentinense TaxID=2970906 RepID=UPI0032DE704E